MSEQGLVVYRTTNTEVIDAFKTARSENIAWRERCIQWAKSIHPDALPVKYVGWGDELLTGIKHVEPIPEGWRLHKQGHLVPFKSKKEGKAFAKQIDEMNPAPNVRKALTGMPPGAMIGMGYESPGVQLRENGSALYVRWSGEPTDTSWNKEGSDLDLTIWERVPLSRYYAVVESEPEEVSA